MGEVFDLNVRSVIVLSTAAIAHMRSAGGGAIVNTGSKQGITTPPGDTAYNVSKAGVRVVTEAQRWARRSPAGGRRCGR